MTSRRYKAGLIHCLLDRIWRICSLGEDKTAEIKELKKTLATNDYPPEVVEAEIDKFLQKKVPVPATETETVEKVELPEKRFIPVRPQKG